MGSFPEYAGLPGWGATYTYQPYSDLELWPFLLTQANQNSSFALTTRRLQQDLGREEGGPGFLQDTQGKWGKWGKWGK